MDPPKNNFLNGSSSGASVFAVGRYLRCKYFDMCFGGIAPLGDPPKANLLTGLIYDASVF